MKLSIAVITWNRCNQLLEAIDSCTRCILPKDVEFIIIDNASTDNTEYAIKEYFKKNLYPYYYEKMSNNIGAGEGRNIAFANCHGEYVYFIDDDAYIDVDNCTDFFQRALLLLDSHPNVMTLTTQIFDLAWKDNRLSNQKPIIDDSLMMCYMVCGGSHFLRSSFFRDSSPYFPNKYGYEELQPSLRVFDAGYLNGYTSAIRVIHNPLVNKWDFSKKNTDVLINEIANQYAIKSSVYPRSVSILCWIAYTLRRVIHLNPVYYKECNRVVKRLKRDYYFGKRIKLKTVMYMISTFGFSIY